MKIASLAGRAVIVTEQGMTDIGQASNGRFPSRVDELIPQLDALRQWAAKARLEPTDPRGLHTLARNPGLLDAPLTRPRQVFAIGLNYRSHAHEVGMALPKQPMVFTKFPSSITGPGADIALPAGTNDWEVEMVAVIGKGGRGIPREAALAHVAAYCVGQDISERTLQFADSPAQFGLAKSFAGFAPIGPWLTTADEVPEPGNLAIGCAVNGETVQSARTSAMIFDLPAQISFLSSVCELYPGDLIFTGTPEGVGVSRKPPRFLQVGDLLQSTVEGLGSLSNRCVAVG